MLDDVFDLHTSTALNTVLESFFAQCYSAFFARLLVIGLQMGVLEEHRALRFSARNPYPFPPA
ncbi:hypothetical protein [Rhodococcus opacus]|uniref:hypothetical protein n=1 Tax=Rhodococcus opacus TaxID=37919 RepID=UPI0018E194D5|nr:hypothetical protein [Rhodococcus opacus]